LNESEFDTMENVLGADAVNVLVSYLLEMIKFLQPTSHSFLASNVAYLKENINFSNLYHNVAINIVNCLINALVRKKKCFCFLFI
jgi:hypothetical protein